MYSQRDEEVVILKHTPKTGRFLDCGSFWFSALSNVRALAENGWGGVLVEPDPANCAKLMEETKDFKDLQIVNALATVGEEGLVKFYSSEAVSSADPEHVALWAKHSIFKPIWCGAVKIRDIVLRFGGIFQFVNIDCEGMSHSLLRALDLKAMDCRLVCVEADKHEHEICAHLGQQGYTVIHRTAENIIAKRA